MVYHPDFPERVGRVTKTCDPGIVIESQTPTSVIYLVPATGERWRIDGVCNKCGACWVGCHGPVPVLDSPVRPEIKEYFPECVLSGEYL
jgi:hypothetical protein